MHKFSTFLTLSSDFGKKVDAWDIDLLMLKN